MEIADKNENFSLRILPENLKNQPGRLAIPAGQIPPLGFGLNAKNGYPVIAGKVKEGTEVFPQVKKPVLTKPDFSQKSFVAQFAAHIPVELFLMSGLDDFKSDGKIAAFFDEGTQHPQKRTLGLIERVVVPHINYLRLSHRLFHLGDIRNFLITGHGPLIG